jgi:hypothetical protein
MEYIDVIVKENNLIFDLLSLAKMKDYIVSIELLNSGDFSFYT